MDQVRRLRTQSVGCKKPSRVSVPLFDESHGGHAMLLPRETNPAVIDRAARIVPDRSYTLSEAAELSGIPRDRWRNWVCPSDGNEPRMASSKPNGKHILRGQDIAKELVQLAAIPENTRPLKDVASVLGKGYKAVRRGKLALIDGQPYLEYKRTDGHTLLIPVYPDLSGQRLLVSASSYELIREDHEEKQGFLEWDQAQDRMAEQGVHIINARLKERISKKLVTHGHEKFLAYTSPDRTVTEVPVMQMTRKCGRGVSYQIRTADLDRLIDVILRDQKTFVQLQDMLYEMGLELTQVHNVLNTRGRWFSIDGQQSFIRLYQPVKCSLSFIRQTDMELFIKWMTFHNGEKHDYERLMSKCNAFSRKSRHERFGSIISGLESVDGELIHTLGGQLGIRIREFDGVYYVRKGNSAPLIFYLNITNEVPYVQIRALNALVEEMKERDAGLSTAIKLWIVREQYMSFNHESIVERPEVFKRFDDLFSRKRATDLLERYPIDELSEWAAGSDFRYYG